MPWPDASAGGAAGAAAETAYLPPYPGAGEPHPPQRQRPAVPDAWFRDAQPQSPSPAQADAAAQTAYLPPVRQPEPPQGTGGGVPWPDASAGGAAGAAAETAYLPPVRDAADAAAETAYLPPYPVPGQPQAPAVPDAWFRDAQPQLVSPAQADAAAETAYLPPVRDPQPPADAAAETAYLPPVRDAQPPADVAAAETAYLPPVPPVEDAAAQTAYLPPVREAGPEPAAAGAEWSPPTLGGNTLRAVDPAQARAEGRSPIIDPGPQSAILTAALGLLLAGAAALGQYALLLPLIALQGLTAAGWFRLNGMWPARQGIALAFAGALVADGAVLAVDGTYGPGAIIGTLGVWVLLTLVLQLRSHADPDERMYGLMASVASAALAIACTGFLAAGWEAVSTGAAAVAVAVFARALPLPTAPSVGVSLAAAAGAGIAVGGLVGLGAGGALVGLAAGVCALVGLRVAAYDYPSKFVHMTAGVALPLAVAAPVVYLIGRVVG
ncbi:membrane protein [Streptomyces katrae]|uniref:Membrane protein n=1 Tax=Streptomyces katrae TaxID=68223 RepID=A0A0F4J035_9ACTN|nr:membrane protein [Streptomyces katrae]